MNAKTKQTTEDKDLSVQTDFLPTEPEEVSEPASEPVQEEFDLGDSKVIFQEEQPLAEQPNARVGSNFWDQDEEWVATGIGETPDGNIVQVKKRENGSGYALSLRNGGILPPLYTGWYTSYDKAREAGYEYLNTLQEKVESA